MFGYKIHAVIFTILTNQILCDLLREGNEDTKNTEKIDKLTKSLYEKYPRNMFGSPAMQDLQSSFSPNYRSTKSPLILTLGFEKPEGLNYNRENAMFFRHPRDFRGYRAENRYNRYSPLSVVHYYSFDSDGDKELVYWMEPSYSMGIGYKSFDNLRFPIHYMMTQPPDIKYTGPVPSSEMKHHNPGLPSNSPQIEILESIGYTIPSDITTYYPTTYAKDYFIDVPPPSTTKPQNYDMQSLLLGEVENNSDGKEQNEIQTVESYNGMANPSDKNENPSFGINRPNQYYYSNRKPITFEQRVKNPQNIYEIISAEKIIPKEVDMTVHTERYQMPYTNWKPMIISGNKAEGSDAIAVKSSVHENVTVKSNESFKKNSDNEQVRNDLEIILTGGAVERIGEDLEKSTNTEMYGIEAKSNVNVLTGKEIESDEDLKTEAQISVVSISEIENTTNNIID